ncbi:hypothetical protein [Actinoplanes aureus]|uniref:Uncharacterized protein n=1 Tax=Actinoplanes aureus TaxID=2792083 RepID=A0A931C8P5_9ACTN|nr:hypothetical protein [Actinoplanes aureus]MBG0563432.1 hypothetical protein [Actinoplanes aureus]
MSLWHRIRDESAGAWRSLRYDLGRRPVEPTGGPDVTSTGMSTFPGSLVDLPVSQPDVDARPPRRFVAVTTFCLLAVLGAGGSYFAATTVFAEQSPGSPGAPPAAAPATGSGSDEAGLGSGPVTAGRPRTTPAVAAGGAAPVAAGPAGQPATTIPVAGDTPSQRPAPRPATRPADPECHCPTPPAPTPTAPSATPPRNAGPAPSGTSAEPSAEPGNSGEPGPSANPSGSAEAVPNVSPSAGDSGHHHHRRNRH